MARAGDDDLKKSLLGNRHDADAKDPIAQLDELAHQIMHEKDADQRLNLSLELTKLYRSLPETLEIPDTTKDIVEIFIQGAVAETKARADDTTPHAQAAKIIEDRKRVFSQFVSLVATLKNTTGGEYDRAQIQLNSLLSHAYYTMGMERCNFSEKLGADMRFLSSAGIKTNKHEIKPPDGISADDDDTPASRL